jgi:lysophospholipase L1-like esterase
VTSRLLSAIGFCLISFFLLELSLTILDPWLSHGAYVYDAELGFRVRPGALGSNSLGFNDRERPPRSSDTIRVVILGDSFNWKGGERNYTHLLEEEFVRSHPVPPVEILNAGFPMTHTGEQLALLKQTLPVLDPDLVVLAFFAGNDFTDAQPYRKRIVANDALIDIDPRHEMRLFGRPILFQSRVWTLLTQEIRRRTKATQADAGTLTPQAYDQVALVKLNFLHRETRAGSRFGDNISFVREKIREMRDHLQQRGIAFAIVILPDEIQVDDRVLARVLDRYGLSRADYLIDLPQSIVQGIAREDGIPTLDLTSGFREAAAREATPLYLPENTHWNDRGNQLAASLLLPWLKERIAQLPSRSGEVFGRQQVSPCRGARSFRGPDRTPAPEAATGG